MILGGFKPSVDVFNVLLGAIVEKKRGFEDVVFIYEEMVKAAVLPNFDTLNYLLEVLCANSSIESALDQFRRMNKKGFSQNSRKFEMIIKGLILINRVDDSVIILGEISDAGFEPELTFYTCIMPLCMCENHRLDDANNLLEEMIENSRTPAVDVLVDLVAGLCAIGKFDEAMNFLEDKCGYVTSPHNAMLEGCCNAVPDSATYSALVVGNCQLRNYEDALQVFHWYVQYALGKSPCSVKSYLVVVSPIVGNPTQVSEMTWERIKKFLMSPGGQSAIMASQCSYEAGAILKNMCFTEFTLGDLLQILNMVITIKKWIIHNQTGWQPIVIAVAECSAELGAKSGS
ncbi:putative pentatricopeptide repeat-containing protein At3g16710, mitochondrial [Mangifera indica]|uniref:putative pentatricopeptide repeat-containing protein At3g16710, mitochondrial n=1 Tax=Mangifera indica TaxID=29780 RepID=UPI001CFA3265|nr:putative pentatricopeptide repeat-containing protein At3g16710, mitochondrial [Mangifera indica]